MDGITMGPRRAARRAACALCIGVTAMLIALSSCSDALINEMTRLATEANLPTISPAATTTITAHEIITLSLPNAEVGAKIEYLGSIWFIAPPPSTLAADKKIVLNGGGGVTWKTPTGNLVIRVTSGGQTTTYTYAYTVFKGVCVSLPTNTPYPGSSATQGTALMPLDTIASGIAKAKSLYIDTLIGPAAVAVAAGTYSINWAGDTASQIKMVEGISLLGGYATDWKSRSSSPTVSKVVDNSAAATTSTTYTVFCGSAITANTVINGFTIEGGGGKRQSYAIGADGSPTISNNIILAGPDNPSGDASTFRAAIEIGDSASTGPAAPVITGNTINGDPGCGGLHVGQCSGIYLYAAHTGPADIAGNSIYAGTAGDGSLGLSGLASAVFFEAITPASALQLRNNRIEGGNASTDAGIYFLNSATQTVDVNNNLILSGICPTNSGTSAAVYLDTTDNHFVLRNNTIVGTDHGVAVNILVCLYSSGANPVFDNNIFLVQHKTGTNASYALYDTVASPGYTPRNNDYYVMDAADVIYHHGATNSSTPPGVNSTTQNPLLNASYAPSASVTTVCTGGMDGAASGWSFTTDRNAVTRTGNGATGWSMGCFEVD